MVDGAGVVGKEVGGRDVAAGHDRSGDAELQRGPRREGGGQARRLGRGVQRRLDGRGPGRIGRGGRGHRQGEGQVGALRHADLLADQVIRPSLERDGLTDLGVLWRGERHRQQHLALIAVVHQRRQRQLLGRRPDDVAGGPARRQGPGQGRGLAGIAGIAPVGVPAWLDHLAQGHMDHAAGRHGRLVRYQGSLDMGGRGRPGGACKAGPGGGENREQFQGMREV